METFELTRRETSVGIHYTVWHNITKADGVWDIQKILAANPDHPEWGRVGGWHFWGEPAIGHYRSDDPDVIRTHMRQIRDAGIDFIVLDNTNAERVLPEEHHNASFREPVKVLLDTCLAMRAEGEDTPGIVFWNKSMREMEDVEWPCEDVWEHFVKDGRYASLWVHYGGKPLMLVTDIVPESFSDRFTLRCQWALRRPAPETEWTFFSHYPQHVARHDGKPEQISVSPAHQYAFATDATMMTRRGGLTFQEQWRRAFSVRPTVVSVTWWNEWAAYRFLDAHGETAFVDLFNPAASRDLEPMKDLALEDEPLFPGGTLDPAALRRARLRRGWRAEWISEWTGVPAPVVLRAERGYEPGAAHCAALERLFARPCAGHGDQYYRWLCRYVSAYKNAEPFPEGLLDNALLPTTEAAR